MADNTLNSTLSSAPFSSEMAKSLGSGNSYVDSKAPAILTQTERLYTTRSRSVNRQDGGGDRGERAFIKILTTDATKSIDRQSGQSHGNAKPTSLGTATSGVLKDAVIGGGYASFLLTDVNCSLEEKLQVVEVFGDAEVTYYFGRQPIMFNFGGMLIDSVDNNWFIEWIEMYAHVMRGTELARNYELIRIVLPNMTIEGTITRMSWSQNSGRDVDIPFQFGFLAKQITPNPVIVPNRPLTNDPVINWNKASGFLDKTGQNTIKSNSLNDKMADLQSVISNPNSSIKDYASSLTNFNLEGVYTPPQNLSSGYSPLNTNGISSSPSSLFSGVSPNLSGVRASLFSPVYGVLSSLTKLIKTTGGDVSKVVNSFISPVRNILRDVKNISNQAIGVVNLVNNQVRGVTNQVSGLDRDIKTTLALLKKTGGVITSAPKTVAASLKDLFNAGKLPITTRFIGGGSSAVNSGMHSTNKIALLNSGKKHTAESGAKI